MAEEATSIVNFFAIGDFGKPGERLRRLAEGMSKYGADCGNPDIILGLGDNFYPSGVQSVDDDQWATTWGDNFLTFPNLRVPWYVVLGNHDYGWNPQAQIDFTNHPSNPEGIWRCPSNNFSFQHKGVEFFALDTNGVQRAVTRNYPDAEENLHRDIDHLNSALGASKSPWKFVFAHHPMHTKGRAHSTLGHCLRGEEYTYFSDGREVTGRGFGLERVLSTNGVAAYITGHEHVFQHHVDHGVHNFVAGAAVEYKFYQGRSETEPMDWFDETRAMGFLAAEVRGDTATFRFVSVKGDDEVGAHVEVIKEVEFPRPRS